MLYLLWLAFIGGVIGAAVGAINAPYPTNTPAHPFRVWIVPYALAGAVGGALGGAYADTAAVVICILCIGTADRAINATLAAPQARRVTTAVVRVLFGAAVVGGLLWLLQ